MMDLPTKQQGKSILQVIRDCLQNDRTRLMVTFRLAQYYSSNKLLGRLARSMYRRSMRRAQCIISLKADIGPRLVIPHPNGIVIGKGVKIGSDVTIFQQVTLGARRMGDDGLPNAYPVIGDNVILFAGAKLIGNMKVGDHSQVGCNAVVLQDVPAHSVAVGVPAKILPQKNS